MNLYSDRITTEDISDALTAEKKAGRIAGHVFFEQLKQFTPKGSTYGTGWHIKLAASYSGEGRRWGNSGGYGSTSVTAATYDEWGWLLAALYDQDNYLFVGFGPGSPVYEDRWAFEARTGRSYMGKEFLIELDSDEELAQIRKEYAEVGFLSVGDPFPYVLGRGSVKGRMGANRDDGENRHRSQADLNKAVAAWAAGKKQGRNYIKFLPRTRESYSAFAHLDLAKIDELQYA